MNRSTTLLVSMLLAVGSAAAVQSAGAGQPQYAAGDNGSRSVGTTIDDSVITAKVKAELAKADGVDANDVDVDTRSGVVQLTGTVDSDSEAELAENLAAKIDGVSMVQNDLEVR